MKWKESWNGGGKWWNINECQSWFTICKLCLGCPPVCLLFTSGFIHLLLWSADIFQSALVCQVLLLQQSSGYYNWLIDLPLRLPLLSAPSIFLVIKAPVCFSVLLHMQPSVLGFFSCLFFYLNRSFHSYLSLCLSCRWAGGAHTFPTLPHCGRTWCLRSENGQQPSVHQDLPHQHQGSPAQAP